MDKFSVTALGNFASTFATRSLANQRAGFELQFNQLQNNLITRFNEQVDDINEAPLNTQRKINDLQDDSRKLVDALPILQEYRQGNSNNKGQLEALFDEVSALFSSYNQDATVDAADVTAFQEARDTVVTRLENLFVFSHPDVNDADVIQRLKSEVDTLKGLDLVVGTLADNQTLSDTLTKFQTDVSIGITVTQNTISTVLKLEQSVFGKFTGIDADLLELTTDEQTRRDAEIDKLRTNLGNLLQSISISFELNAGFAEALQARLSDQLPARGSVLNLFS